MRLKGFLMTAVVISSMIFAATNWQSLTTNLPMNLFFFPFELPLGLLLLLTSIALCFLFFFLSLIDRAAQLRRITHLEKQGEGLQIKLEKKRTVDIAFLEETLLEKVSTLSKQLDSYQGKLESLTNEGINKLAAQTDEKFLVLEQRVLLVRNELAADIAESEDILKKQLRK